MLLMANLCKHYKWSVVEKGSRFDPPAILFCPKANKLKMDNVQEFNLCDYPTNKQSTYKFKAHPFLNGMAKDVLEWGKQLAIAIKSKPVKSAKSKFDLVEAILKGNALMH
eukprot:8521994-Ditylum_brightwellii.AAC.1